MTMHNKISFLGFLTAIATACGPVGDPGEDGSSDGTDPTVASSETTPIPLTCSYEGAVYESGEEIASADGCVTFRCDEGILTMLEDSFTVVDGDLELVSQADVDALECLREVTGSLRITGTTSDISTLNQLARVGGSLEIHGSALTTLNGIGGLAEIGAGVVIADNASLTTLAFAPYMSVFGDATIQNNDVLASLAGAEFLGACNGCSHAPPMGAEAGDEAGFTAGDEAPEGGTFYGNILIADNDVLVDITALGNLWFAWADVRLRANLALADITAMSSLAEVRGVLEISGHPALDDATVQAFATAVDVWGERIVCGNGAGAAC